MNHRADTLRLGLVLAAFMACVLWIVPACGGPDVEEDVADLGQGQGTQPTPGSNTPSNVNANDGTASLPPSNTEANARDNEPVDPIVSTTQGGLGERLQALMNVEWNWPTGYWPYGLRVPSMGQATNPAFWNAIEQARIAWDADAAAAQAALEEAAGLEESADTVLAVFNLGAFHQAQARYLFRRALRDFREAVRARGGDVNALPPNWLTMEQQAAISTHRFAAIELFARVATLPLQDDDSRWSYANFRPFASRALASLHIEAGQLGRAVEAIMPAIRSERPYRVWTVPVEGGGHRIAGERIADEPAREQLLPVIYWFAGVNIRDETETKLRVLLLRFPPSYAGDSAPELVARFFRDAAGYLQDNPELADDWQWPRCYTQSFLTLLYRRMVETWPEHPAVTGIAAIATEIGIPSGE